MKLLAIDDNRDNLTVLKAVVQGALPECDVLTAQNGAQGISLARSEDPDVILLDIVMPRMDGFEVCRRLKADETLRSIPVVFLTALRADRDDRVKALEVGAEGFLSKPLDELELLAELRAMAKVKAANRLQRLEKEEMAALVAARTRELEQELSERKRAERDREQLQAQLAQAQKMESVGRLAGGVAHDFNNLLMGIMNYVELCRDELPPDHPIRCYLDEITSDAQRSANITRQLLAFARKQTIAPKVLDLNDTVASMLRLLRRLVGEDIELAWLPGACLWPVEIDPSQIDQVLANLCVNARDAINGVGKITIETANVTLGMEACNPGHGDYVLLAVTDDGCGMDKDVLAHLFEPFFTTKTMGKGTGLGLATVHGIVTQNNGTISVCSEPGRETTFKLYLPRYVGPAAAPADPVRPSVRPGGQETILLVEDEKSVRVTACHFLERLGYRVRVAAAPEEALRLAAAPHEPIHLLITDVVMPGMSGRDLAEELQKQRPEMKCLFISGYTADIIVKRGVLDQGMQFLGKPFSRDDLARKVREVLGTD